MEKSIHSRIHLGNATSYTNHHRPMAGIKQITFIIGICGICLSSSAQIEPDSILLKDRKPVVGTFNGVNRNLNSALKWDRFTGSVYFDGYLNLNAARPKDNTQTTSATLGRCNEFDISLISLGGKFQEDRAWERFICRLVT